MKVHLQNKNMEHMFIVYISKGKADCSDKQQT